MKKWILIFISVLIILVGIVLFWGFYRLQNTPEQGPETLILLDRNRKLLANTPNQYGWRTEYTGNLESEFNNALLLIEDKRFYTHLGVDVLSKWSALAQNISEGEVVRGGSTITEQYIKNIYFPGAKRTYLEKAKEATLAFLLTVMKDKETVLRDYLNGVYLGNRIYGIDTAIRTYFSKSRLEELSKEEIITLLALIKYPGISTLEDTDFIDYRKQVATRLGWTNEVKALNPKFNFNSPLSTNSFPLLTEQVREEIELYKTGGANQLLSFLDSTTLPLPGKITPPLTLSIELSLEEHTTNALKSLLVPLEKHHVTNGAIYIYDPHNEKVLAYVGNRSENGGGNEIDMIQRRRSVGSLLKPFLYLKALEEGAEIDTFVLDSDRIYDTEAEDKKFIPTNYSLRAYGPVPLREALGNSLNMAAVRLTETIGLDVFYRKLMAFGLDLNHESTYYGYGLVLGGAELTLENVVQSFANLIFPQKNCTEGTPENHGNHPCDPEREKNLFLLQHILSNPGNRARAFGINSILNTSIPMAVKTGTSTDFRDNWTLSYHPDAVIGVWVGNLDSSPMTEVSGITGAGRLWHDIAEYMIKMGFIKNTPNTIPDGVHASYLCLDSGCFQRQKTYKKNDKESRSHILEKAYFRSDFFTLPNEEEMKRWNIQY